MTDTYTCPRFKSHREKEWRWEQMSNGETRAAVYCIQCEGGEFIDVVEQPDLYLDLLGRNQFPIKTDTLL